MCKYYHYCVTINNSGVNPGTDADNNEANDDEIEEDDN